MTIFDNADWHADGEFPRELPTSAGATHIGMFLAWCADHGLLVDSAGELAEPLASLAARTITPGAFALTAADGILSSDLLTDEGSSFAEDYYLADDDDADSFDDDYVDVFIDDGPTIYHVPDSWESFSRIAPVLTLRYQQWRERTH